MHTKQLTQHQTCTDDVPSPPPSHSTPPSISFSLLSAVVSFLERLEPAGFQQTTGLSVSQSLWQEREPEMGRDLGEERCGERTREIAGQRDGPRKRDRKIERN